MSENTERQIDRRKVLAATSTAMLGGVLGTAAARDEGPSKDSHRDEDDCRREYYRDRRRCRRRYDDLGERLDCYRDARRERRRCERRAD
jgi:hypothetical protein